MRSKDETQLIKNMRKRIAEFAMPFESRWTFAALRAADRDVATRLHEQQNLFSEACVRMDARDIVDQANALCRGYAVAFELLEASRMPDDAYMIGIDPATGCKVAIGQCDLALQRIRDLHGDNFVWLTPENVARMFASIESFKAIDAVRKVFPDAEILDRYSDETPE
jgi:hypothetical protein